MTISVAVNEAVLLRGVSGSARATGQLSEALREISYLEVIGVRPSVGRRNSRIRNALGDAYWDLRGAAQAARTSEVLISPCNIGRAFPSQRHLLVVYDTMIWESPELFDPGFGAYARLLVPFSMKHADRVLTLSSHARDFLSNLVPNADVHVLTLPGRRGPVGQAVWSTARRTVLMVGETAPHKNHIAGIEAVRLLRARRGVDVRLHLIGPEGRSEPDVQRALAKADPDSVWTRRSTRMLDEEVDRAYETSWVLAQPSLNEGYGLPLVEACQRGLPVLHSGVGGMSEVLPQSSINSTQADAFAEGLERLLSRDTWTSAASAVRRQADRFTWDAFSDAIRLHLRALATSSTDERI